MQNTAKTLRMDNLSAARFTNKQIRTIKINVIMATILTHNGPRAC